MEFYYSDLQVLESLTTNCDKVVAGGLLVCYLVIDTDMGKKAKLIGVSIAVLLCLRK